jgi:hypothetical protein
LVLNSVTSTPQWIRQTEAACRMERSTAWYLSKTTLFESHNPFVPMFPAYLQILPYLQIYRSVSPDLQIWIVTLAGVRLLCTSDGVGWIDVVYWYLIQ